MEDDKGRRAPVWREGLVWGGCVAAAVVPKIRRAFARLVDRHSDLIWLYPQLPADPQLTALQWAG